MKRLIALALIVATAFVVAVVAPASAASRIVQKGTWGVSGRCYMYVYDEGKSGDADPVTAISNTTFAWGVDPAGERYHKIVESKISLYYHSRRHSGIKTVLSHAWINKLRGAGWEPVSGLDIKDYERYDEKPKTVTWRTESSWYPGRYSLRNHLAVTAVAPGGREWVTPKRTKPYGTYDVCGSNNVSESKMRA